MNVWKTGNPPVADNKSKDFIVAVRRAHNPEKVFVFAATFANNFSEDELRDKDGNEFIANGWFTVAEDSSGEFNEFYMPMLDKGDEVVGWQEFPKWSDKPEEPEAFYDGRSKEPCLMWAYDGYKPGPHDVVLYKHNIQE